MYRAYQCGKCGEVHLGSAKPQECPSCGAEKLHLKAADQEKFEEIMPQKVQERLEEAGSTLDLDEDLPEISSEFMKRIKKSARKEGLAEAYRLFAEEISQEEAERFFRALGEGED